MIFATDLDNTLIYSDRKSAHLRRRVCVEWRDGEELSYMESGSYAQLRKLAGKLALVPVTTRSLEQYRRIRLFGDTAPEPELALVSNGGLLLHDGQPDQAWFDETRRLTACCARQMALARDCLERDPGRCFAVREVDGLFLFTKTQDETRTLDALEQVLDPALVTITRNLQKIYVQPRCLTKGLGIRRLRKWLRQQGHGLAGQPVLAAGDSAFDSSMLREADLAVALSDPALVRDLSGSAHVRFWTPEKGQDLTAFTAFVLDFAGQALRMSVKTLSDEKSGH